MKNSAVNILHYFAFHFSSTSMHSALAIIRFFFGKSEAMDGDSQAASERILLEPYKYLLQLPGESFFMLAIEV